MERKNERNLKILMMITLKNGNEKPRNTVYYEHLFTG